MNYEETLNYIHSIPKFRRPLGNENLSALLENLNDPHRGIRFIHIAGTNGKGSTAAMTAEILKRAGYRTGLFTSPFIEVFNERIRINGESIPDAVLTEYASRVKSVMEGKNLPVSEFAFITAAAMLYFYEQRCDFVVLEAGMGGRLDATNVINESEVSVICKIALDHTQYLGETIEEITREKCGIIKENGTVVAYPNEDNVTDIIKETADEKHASLYIADVKNTEGYTLSLMGAYQKYNAAVVLEILKTLREKGYKIPESAVKDGLKNTSWPARFEYAADDVIIDGAHNLDGVKALKESLLSLKKPITLVMAMMSDKSYGECVREIAPVAERFIATEIDMPRCVSAEEIAEKAGEDAMVIKDTAAAVKEAMRQNGGIVCICGSLYLAGEVKRILKKAR